MESLVKIILGLRYRIRVEGLAEIASRGRRGILFLPNHPALIDPVILLTLLYRDFRARPLGVREALSWSPARWVAHALDAILMPDPSSADRQDRQEILDALEGCAAALEQGDNVVLWPAGRLATSRHEDLAGNFAAAFLVERVAAARVVLVRTSGLWGSRFSRARGETSSINRLLLRGALAALGSGLLLMPRRTVNVSFLEHRHLPPAGDRRAFNDALQSWYNRGRRPAVAVALTWWSRHRSWELPDPPQAVLTGDTAAISKELRARVVDHLEALSGVPELSEELHLARDLGLDSLQRAELCDWLATETDTMPNVDTLHTVRDVLLVAGGHVIATPAPVALRAPTRWFTHVGDERPSLAPGATVAAAFLAAAQRHPSRPAVADLTSGVRSYRRLLMGIAALSPLIRTLPGSHVGLMLPASVGADVLYLAILCAGRIPVMVNWTSGPRNVVHGLDLVGVQRVLTARALVTRLQPLGVDFAPYAERLAFIEDLAGSLSAAHRARAMARALRPASLIPDLDPAQPAVVLFTSGSETRPKAVPLSHRNLLANLEDIGRWVPFEARDRLLSILPPFHSFGLTAGMLMPLLFGIPAIHHANPREGATLVQLVQAFGATLLGGTPTFLEAMIRVAAAGQLSSLRLCVTGGERCPDRVFDGLDRLAPNAEILEGYGVTECSPIVAINTPGQGRRGTVGRVMPSLEQRILHGDEDRPVSGAEIGRLVVAGPSVFNGYLGPAGADPFVELDGRRWYDTGDLVSMDDDGFITIRGRQRRFVKLGGEMVSLPAIEEVLLEHLDGGARDAERGPAAAVLAVGDEPMPQIVLVSTVAIDRARANGILRSAGLSPLHAFARVHVLAEIPVLGSGKTDYRALAARLGEAPSSVG